MRTLRNSRMGDVSTSAAIREPEDVASVVGASGLDRISTLLRLLRFRDPGPLLRSLKSDFRFRGFDSLEILFNILSLPKSTLSRTSLLKGTRVLLLSQSNSSSSPILSKTFAGGSTGEGVALLDSRGREFESELRYV